MRWGTHFEKHVTSAFEMWKAKQLVSDFPLGIKKKALKKLISTPKVALAVSVLTIYYRNGNLNKARLHLEGFMITLNHQ